MYRPIEVGCGQVVPRSEPSAGIRGKAVVDESYGFACIDLAEDCVIESVLEGGFVEGVDTRTQQSVDVVMTRRASRQGSYQYGKKKKILFQGCEGYVRVL